MSKVLVRLALLVVSVLVVKPAHAQYYPYWYGYTPYWAAEAAARAWAPPVYPPHYARPVYVAPPAAVYSTPRNRYYYR